MDVIREHLVYKNVPMTVCMKDFKPIEQYEFIRLLLASQTKNVKVCMHESTNSYITHLLKELSVELVQCSQGTDKLQKFDLQAQ
jgi:hypothetical protein